MNLWTIVLILTTVVIVTAGWGDVLHSPEFVKHMGEIGNYNDNLIQDEEERRYNKRSLFTSVLMRKLMRKLDKARFRTDSQKMMKEDGLMKRFYAMRGLRNLTN